MFPPSLPPLSAILPSIILGTATFNSQYNEDPLKLNTTQIVHKALAEGIRAFDTSPYYGPAEELLGRALDCEHVLVQYSRAYYYVMTKVGRISGSHFDYSPSWVRRSVVNSLTRLRVDYLDVVFCHDVEFVSTDEVIAAVTELRKIRDETGRIRYVGISGYPVDVLCSLAQTILERTGRPLDAVMSYANFTLQNTRLASVGLPRLKAAGVEVVLNASPLGMGLLRHAGVPIGAQGDFHPSPIELRNAIKTASDWCETQNERIENIALRFALENWYTVGATLGSMGNNAGPWPRRREVGQHEGKRRGVSVLGVSRMEELDETVDVWRSVLAALEDDEPELGRDHQERPPHLLRQEQVRVLAQEIRRILGPLLDYAWPSPGPGFVRQALTSGPSS